MKKTPNSSIKPLDGQAQMSTFRIDCDQDYDDDQDFVGFDEARDKA